MYQKYSWHFIFLIKFLLSRESEENKEFLFNLLKNMMSKFQYSHIGLDFCIETDMPIGEIISGDLSISKDLKPPYFILFRANFGPMKLDSENLNFVKLKGTEISVQLLDLKSCESLANQEDLIGIFRKIVLDVESNHTLLVTWDHGSGYSIFSEPDPVENLIAANTESMRFNFRKRKLICKDNFEKMDKEITFRQFHPFNQNKAVLERESTKIVVEENAFIDSSIENIPPILTMDELANAISALCSKRGQVDILIMLNCFMQSIDTQFALQDKVNYLIASPTIVVTELYDFQRIFQSVLDDPKIAPNLLCESILESVKTNTSLIESGYLEKISVFTVNLEDLRKAGFYQLFNEISQFLFLSAKEKSFLNSIKSITSGLEFLPTIDDEITDFKTFFFIDGLSFFNMLKSDLELQKEIEQSIQIQRFVSIYDEFSGKENERLNHIGELAADPKFNSSGFSIFFPFSTNQFENCNYIKYFYNEHRGNDCISAIARQTFWDNFLFLYYKFVKGN